MLVEGKLDQLSVLKNSSQLILEQRRISLDRLTSSEVEIVEVEIPITSELIGHTLSEMKFKSLFSCSVLAILRNGEPIWTNFESKSLLSGDRLLLHGEIEKLDCIDENELTRIPVFLFNKFIRNHDRDTRLVVDIRH